MTKISHLIKGKNAESLAANFLKKQGLKIVARNENFQFGEIDIVAKDKETIVFVEVKYRSDESYGTASEMVGLTKQKRLRKAALTWIQQNDPQMDHPCRFDVIAISKNKAGKFEWIQNAF